MKSITKATVALAAAATLVAGSAVAASAYPAGTAMGLVVSRVSGVLAASKISASATHVKPDCIVSLGWDNQNKTSDDYLDYDWFDVVSSRTGNTPRKALSAPKIAGDYSVFATTESGCVGDAEYNPAGEAVASQTVRVGTKVVPTINLDVTKAKKLTASGTFGGYVGESVILTLNDLTANKVVKTVTVKTKASGYTNTFTGLKTGNQYNLVLTYTPTAKYFIDSLNGRVTATRVKVVR